MPETTTETPVRDLLVSMTAESLAASDLDTETLMLVRIAALVAADAPPISYMLNLEAARSVGIDADKVSSVIAAIAPIVGTARVASAAGSILKSLAIEIELEELEEQDEQ